MQALDDLNVALVVADMTSNETSSDIKQDLERIQLKGGGTQSNIPVNMIYPADYPISPAVLLDEVISPDDVLKALEQATGQKLAVTDG